MNLIEKFNEFKEEFTFVFIEGKRYEWLLDGLVNTLKMTFYALIIGIVIGIIVAAVRSTYDKNSELLSRRSILVQIISKVANWICNVYLTVIRGTPVVVQLMIIYFVILPDVKNGVLVGTIAFGINSGAYVAEIFRGGILSIDDGQFEAGRSLGFNYVQTMYYIVLPQAFKTVLPTLCNEFIVLIKETSIAGYVGVMDLTKGAELIRGRTFTAFMPLIATALIYLAMVMILTWLVRKLERRLRVSER